MNPFKVPFALLAFLGFVMVVPAWMWFVNSYPTQLTAESQFLIQLMLPALAMLLLASWLQPGTG